MNNEELHFCENIDLCSHKIISRNKDAHSTRKRLKIDVFDPHPKTFVVVVSHEFVSNFLNICYEVNYQKICLLLDSYTVSKIRNARRLFLKRAAFSRSSANYYPTHLNIFKKATALKLLTISLLSKGMKYLVLVVGKKEIISGGRGFFHQPLKETSS